MEKTPINVDLITAGVFSRKHGNIVIGDSLNNNIPWNIPEDTKYFMNNTLGKICIMGRKTFESIPNRPLKNRLNVVLSFSNSEKFRSSPKKEHNQENVIYVKSFDDLYFFLKDLVKNKEKHTVGTPMVIGGGKIYSYFMSGESASLFSVKNIFLTEIKCQEIKSKVSKISNPVFFDVSLIHPKKYKLESYNYSEKNDLVYIIISKNNSENTQKVKKYDTLYKELCEEILENGEERGDRTNIGTLSTFGAHISIDVSEHCPILTTKWVAWKTCIKELLWFLKGQTDSKILESQGVNIWKGNTSREFLDSRNLDYPEGKLGPGYGWQIRRSGAEFPGKEGGVDQLKYIEKLLSEDPTSRRIMWNLWVPKDLEKMALTPCHCQMQLYVSKKKTMDMSVYIRSNDIFLGNPFNVFSYYVLLKLLCVRHSLKPGKLILNLGDSHIYLNHIEQIKEQLARSPRVSPELIIDPGVSNKKWEEIDIQDFDLVGYFPDKNISGAMAI
jgi:thymidylate synthase